ncbi:MAG: Stp1/IreP family PP2C-type Ser/Thr phosphatase [Pseudomonadales bacterium]|nr:Stp1/IreP family PP2C-type Ser/Thr phosphatase [Pseudomonadales bacterium]
MNLKGIIEFTNQTDVGRVRDHNEDYIHSEESIGLAVLADGMGGLNAGEVASSMSVHLLVNELTAYRNGTSLLEKEIGQDSDDSMEVQVVKHAIEKANSAVFHVSQTQAQCRGMGTTIVVSLFYDDKVAVGHIGDSRMYRFRNHRLEQLTKDHSFVQELIDKGLCTPEEARTSKKKNVVTRAVGIAPDVEAEVHEYEVQVGDIYLMCSDGLTDLVNDYNIEASLRELNSNLTEVASHLVEVANASGGKDNISIILARVVKLNSGDPSFVKKIVNWFE